MSVSGVPLALGSVAALAAVATVSGRMGSASTRTMIFDGVSLEIEEDLADRAEAAWETYAWTYLGPKSAEVPSRAHYRTLAGKIQAEARRRTPRTMAEQAAVRRMEDAAEVLFQVADHADRIRRNMSPRVPRELNHGDRVRVSGQVPFAGMEVGKIYEVHLTTTARGVPTVSFRKVEESGRVSRHTVGPFPAAPVHAHMKPMGYTGPAGALVVERVAPLELPG